MNQLFETKEKYKKYDIPAVYFDNLWSVRATSHSPFEIRKKSIALSDILCNVCLLPKLNAKEMLVFEQCPLGGLLGPATRLMEGCFVKKEYCPSQFLPDEIAGIIKKVGYQNTQEFMQSVNTSWKGFARLINFEYGSGDSRVVHPDLLILQLDV